MRVAGITLPNNKKITIALRYVYGVGPTLSEEVLAKAKIDGNTKVKDLNMDQQDAIREVVEKQYKTEGELKRQIVANIKRLKDIKCYRGIRHIRHLTVRGQRTKTNSRTVRGNKKNVAVSGRKPAAQKT